MHRAIQAESYLRYSLSSGWTPSETKVVCEANVSLTVNGEIWLNFACTPADLEALAVGFLFNEGIIERKNEIAAVDVCHQGTNVDVWLNRMVERPREWRRTSGCTGGYTSTNGDGALKPVIPSEPLAPDTLLAGMEQLLALQELYREARGIHSSALSDGQSIRALAEDIGRHNTLDKLAGKLLLEELSVQPLIVLTTGRVSSEMLQKAARLGAVAVASRTSPTSQSILRAGQLGITLVGYARRTQFTVYTHPERLTGAPVPRPE